VTSDERPLSDVPAWLWAALAAALVAQLMLQGLRPGAPMGADDLLPAPRAEALRLASFGEAPAGARLTLLYVQAFDLGGANQLPYQKLDYARLVSWLEAALGLDPRSDYALFLASRVYTEIRDPARLRIMMDFVHRAFLQDPERRWAALAHCALIAKHRLGDLPLARSYAAAVARLARSPEVAPWARQMEAFILEDMNELDAARVLLGALLASGEINDPAEARFLKQRLDQLEARLAAKKVK
jgi:hypothetical protein